MPRAGSFLKDTNAAGKLFSAKIKKWMTVRQPRLFLSPPHWGVNAANKRPAQAWFRPIRGVNCSVSSTMQLRPLCLSCYLPPSIIPPGRQLLVRQGEGVFWNTFWNNVFKKTLVLPQQQYEKRVFLKFVTHNERSVSSLLWIAPCTLKGCTHTACRMDTTSPFLPLSGRKVNSLLVLHR